MFHINHVALKSYFHKSRENLSVSLCELFGIDFCGFQNAGLPFCRLARKGEFFEANFGCFSVSNDDSGSFAKTQLLSHRNKVAEMS